MCGVAPSCPAGGKRGASASPYACRPNTGVTNGRAVPAARAPRARAGARCVLGTGSPLAHPASRPSVAPESAGPPADGDRGAALSVHRGGPQPLASTLERDSQTLPRRLAPRRRSRRARETHRVRRAVRAAAHRIDGERDAHHVNLRHWPRRTVMALIRVYQVTLRSEEHTSELQSQSNLVCRLLLEKKKKKKDKDHQQYVETDTQHHH